MTTVSGGDGPTVFIVAGIHGDEVAGIAAAEALLGELTGISGTVCVLSPATAEGAKANDRRTRGYDLNRLFPGDENGHEAQRLAAAIFEEIRRAEPALVLDLHEAGSAVQSYDFLGSSIVFSDPDSAALVMEMTAESAEICENPFTFFSSAPEGSLNREVYAQLGIPVLTIETDEALPLETRVGDQLAMIRCAFAHVGIK